MTLSSPNKIHSVLIKLDKDVPREKALRQFLDDAANNGINRKEAILRLFEMYSGEDPFGNQNKRIEKPNDIKIKETKNDISTLKAKTDISDIDISGFDE